MYTIKWVADRIGVAPGTLRAWEQRYGVVEPARSDGGYRLYDDEDLSILRRMAGLVEAGMGPAQAAAEVRTDGGASPDDNGTSPEPPGGLPDPKVLVAASRRYDVRALERALDAAFAAAGFEHVVDVWLTAAMTEVGVAWSRGDLDISQEHFISAGVLRRLAAAYDAAGHPRAGRHVLTGLAPGATHELATLAFATMLRRAGLRVTYLGPDLPAPSWVEATRTIRPDAVVVGAPLSADAAAATEVVEALAGEDPGIPVYVGGAGTVPDHRLGGTTLAGASNWLAEELTRP